MIVDEFVTLTIKTGNNFADRDFNLRYTLSDSIEEKGIGEVVEERTGIEWS